MIPHLWSMNADFELEIAATGRYRRKPTIDRTNRRLAPCLLWLATEGDGLVLEGPWPEAIRIDAERRGVEIVDPEYASPQSHRLFTPWGWTPSAVDLGRRLGAIVDAPPLDVVAKVNSKLFSHALERELGVAVPGAQVVSTMEELDAHVAAAAPMPNDKWVVKAPMGFAARERVLGRGPVLDPPSATWAARRFASGEQLLFEPWLDVRREYGVQMIVSPDGTVRILGVSDQQTNGAGTTTGYLLGRGVPPERADALERIARDVGARLAREGYEGPANVDALEHAGGLRPLLEINARYTLGFVAVAAERALSPAEPVLWNPREA